jgi:lysine 6-dehydrogenase
MKTLVFGGSGKIGATVGWDLAKQADVTSVGLAGRREDRLRDAREWIRSPKVQTHAMDVLDAEVTGRLMREYDVGVCALPDRRTSYALLDTAVKVGFHMVDMLEEYHRRPDAYEIEGLKLPPGVTLNEYGDQLHNTAIENDVTFLDGIGFAPGISNIMVGGAIRQLDEARVAVARVGGIPSRAAADRHPLRYMITWAFDHVLREYMVKVNILRDGKMIEVDAGSELERFHFGEFGKDEELECAITPGMPSLTYTHPYLQDFTEKTVRWPGHWEGIKVLKECGLLDLEQIPFAGQQISPREFLLAVIEPRLRPGDQDTDVCVMWTSVKGKKAGKDVSIDSYLWDEADTANNISSMARVTGFSAAIGALFIGRGLITKKGIVPPEDCFEDGVYQAFLDELGKRDVRIVEKVTELT